MREEDDGTPLHEGQSLNKGYKTTAPENALPPTPTPIPKSPLDEK
jgi:hypothetical protein